MDAMMHSKVYVVLHDLLNAVLPFDTREEAERYVSSHGDGYRIEEWHRGNSLLYGPIQESEWTWEGHEVFEDATSKQLQVGERVLWRGYFEHNGEPIIGRVVGIYRHGDEATATVAFGVRSLFYREMPLSELERIEESRDTP